MDFTSFTHIHQKLENTKKYCPNCFGSISRFGEFFVVLVHRSVALGVDLPSFPYPLDQIPLIFDKFINLTFGSSSRINFGEHPGEPVLSPKIPARIPPTPNPDRNFRRQHRSAGCFAEKLSDPKFWPFLFEFCSCFACVSPKLTSSVRNISTYCTLRHCDTWTTFPYTGSKSSIPNVQLAPPC